MQLLSDPAHYGTLKHGYARGGEAVTMTENVRTYFDILARLEEPNSPSATPAGEQPGETRTSF